MGISRDGGSEPTRGAPQRSDGAARRSYHDLLTHFHWRERQAHEKGLYVTEHMLGLQRRYPHLLAAFRGRGLLLGMEFPTDELGYEVAAGCFARGMLTAGTLVSAKTIRIEPALTVPYSILDEMLAILDAVFADVNAKQKYAKQAAVSRL
jgi:acetylornithine/succinyldiaminopimelate/putrescine aminotransferase